MQKTRKSGLPENIEMRHDNHFVDLISKKTTGPRLRMIEIVKIDPNPHQARSEVGNLDELKSSIKEKGVLEPILVRPKNGRYEIIAGERRYVASKSIGLEDVPCIVMNVEDDEAMEIALIENLQRKDLDVFEEADGLNALASIYKYNHQKIAQKLGKARSTVTEIINISKIPHEIRDICKKFKITSRSTLIEIAKQNNKENMMKLFYEIRDRDLRREDTRYLSKKIKGKTIEKEKTFVFNYFPKDTKDYKLKIEFKKPSVSKSEIIRILENILEKLKS